MKITIKLLKSMDACEDGVEFFKLNKLNKLKFGDAIRKAVELGNFDYANWFIAHSLTRINRIKYAVYAAELVLPIFEKEYPNDNRPRLAIAAAKLVIADDCELNRYAAYKVPYAAYASANAAYAAANAAGAARAVAYDADYVNKIIEYGILLLEL